MKDFITRCDYCSQDFHIDIKDLHTETTKLKRNSPTEEVEIQYFCCPNCGHKYIYFIADAEIKGLINEHIEFLKADRTGMSKSKFRQQDHRMKSKIQLKMKRLERLYNKQHGAEDNGK